MIKGLRVDCDIGWFVLDGVHVWLMQVLERRLRARFVRRDIGRQFEMGTGVGVHSGWDGDREGEIGGFWVEEFGFLGGVDLRVCGWRVGICNWMDARLWMFISRCLEPLLSMYGSASL
jgi:hypothetical protein